MKVALAHDYLTQRGGAERVVASLRKAFPEAPLYTSLYDPDGTFPEFRRGEVRTLALDRVPLLRRHHRLALPLLAPSFSRLEIDADVAICSSSGWAHGAHVQGRKIVYCHTPARWLYQTDRYLGASPPHAARAALALQHRFLVDWDQAAAASAARYVVNSTVVRDRVRDAYGVDAQVVPPPHTIDPSGPQRPVDVEPGFTLCVARLLPYKNVDAVLAAFAALPGERLVVVGGGPDEDRLRRGAPPNVLLAGRVDDEELRFLYERCSGLVAASYEDFGLTPLEAAAFGRPSAVLSFGGYLDTVRDGETGVFFRTCAPGAIRDAVVRMHLTRWDESTIRAHAASFSERRFIERMRTLADEVARA